MSEVSDRRLSLKREAQKYDDFEEFSRDYSWNLMRGRYWHVTSDPNFKLKKEYAPCDASSLAAGPGGTCGLMVSYTPEVWAAYFPKREYAAEIDLSGACKGVDYMIVDRGFGHEIFVSNIDKVKVVSVVPLEEAVRESDRYNESIPQSEEALRKFFEEARKGQKERRC